VLAQIGVSYAAWFRYQDNLKTIAQKTQCVGLDNHGYLALVNSKAVPDKCLNLSLQESPDQRPGYQEMIVGLPGTQSVLCPINSGKVHPAMQKLIANQPINQSQNLKQDTASYYLKLDHRGSGELSCTDNSDPPRVELRLRNNSYVYTKKRKSNSEVRRPSVRKRLCTTRDGQKSIMGMVPVYDSKTWSDEYNPSPAINQIDMGGQDPNSLPQAGGTLDRSDGSVNLNLEQLGNILNCSRFSGRSNICSHIPYDDSQHRIPHSPPGEVQDMDFTPSESYIPFGDQTPLVDDEINSSAIGDPDVFRQFRSDFDYGEICAPSESCSPAITCEIPKDRDTQYRIKKSPLGKIG
jgi:hypothetical protein